MKDITKKYTNDDITVVWKPAMCIHSKKCWSGLGEVFDPNRKPWIDINAASSADIMEQVTECPSGALSYYKNNEKEQTESVNVETTVEVMKNGPLMVYGNLKVKDKDGNETSKHKVTAFCRCGASSNKPYCDGTHNKINFKDEA